MIKYTCGIALVAALATATEVETTKNEQFLKKERWERPEGPCKVMSSDLLTGSDLQVSANAATCKGGGGLGGAGYSFTFLDVQGEINHSYLDNVITGSFKSSRNEGTYHLAYSGNHDNACSYIGSYEITKGQAMYSWGYFALCDL